MKYRFLLSALLLVLGLPVLPLQPAQAAPTSRDIVIATVVGTNKVLDVRGSSTASGARVQTYTANASGAQIFRLTNCDPAGWCEIRNVKSDKCLDVKHSGVSRGTPVQQYTCNRTVAQKWLPVAAGDGTTRIQSAVAPDRWLDVPHGLALNGVSLQVWSGNTSHAQEFRFVDAPEWGITYAQAGQSSNVTATLSAPGAMDRLFATKVRIDARLTIGSQTVRTVSITKEFAELDDSGSFTFDIGDYGRWTVSATFYRGSTRMRANPAVPVDVVADEYIVAPLTGTMPVTLLTTSLWGQGSIRGSDNGIPVIAQLARARQWDWDKLPPGVHAVPYLTKEQYSTPISGNSLNANLAPLRAYIQYLYSLNPESVFHLYVNDYHVQMVQSLLYANRLPDRNYTITLLSDGTFSYSNFARAYSADPEPTHSALVERWQAAKDYAYANGSVDPFLTVTEAQRYVYALLATEPSARWWLNRPALLTSPGDNNVFAGKAIANPQVVTAGINTKLNAIKAAGATPLAEFKALYRFNDAYFAGSVASGSKVMMFLGTRLDSEASFTDYSAFTMKYYGATYDYYYKGHPATPTGGSPDKKAQLDALHITDVDSSVPAELILFFNPQIYMSGYPSSTYVSVTDPNMAKGLFTLTRSAALASTSPNYSIMGWFMAPKSAYTGAVAALPGDFVVEFSDKVVAQEGYDLATWTSATQEITFFALVDGVYQVVGSR